MKDTRNWLISFFIIVSMILTALAVFASAEQKNRSSARATTLYSPDIDSFLYEDNPNLKLPMASTTKIMTALVAIENSNLSDSVEIPREAIGIEGSSLYLKEGDILTVKDLVYSLMLRSANDAAAALAIHISGDIKTFSDLMNKRARDMGLTDTSFKNPHGLDSDEHYTTAHDLALIAAEALKNDTFKKVCSTYKYSFQLLDGTRTVVNHNKLLRSYEGAIGVKTGYTKKCGRCLVSAAERDDLTLVAVTLDDPNDWQDHASLLDYGFSSLSIVPLTELANNEYTIPVIGGEKDSLTARVNDTKKLIKTKESDIFKASLNIDRYITKSVKKGDAVGFIKIYKNGELYTELEILATETVKQKQVKKRFIFI